MRTQTLIAGTLSVILILNPAFSSIAAASGNGVKVPGGTIVSIPSATNRSLNSVLSSIAMSGGAPSPAPTQQPETTASPAPSPSATPSPAPKHDNSATYVIVGVIVVAAIILATQSHKAANSINLSGVQVQGKPQLGLQIRF